MITLSYYGKFNLSNCKVESRDGKVLRVREGTQRGTASTKRCTMMKTSWGGISHYPRRSREIVQESLELNQHRLREERK